MQLLLKMKKAVMDIERFCVEQYFECDVIMNVCLCVCVCVCAYNPVSPGTGCQLTKS
jgi:hypothetical protein